MRAVVQRIHKAAVVVDGETTARIDAGLLIYLGVATDDDDHDSRQLAEKTRYLRIFPDERKPLNCDVLEAGGAALVISAFTTQADARKGRRPALGKAAEPRRAEQLYELYCRTLRDLGVQVETGCFGEHMDIVSTNDGPICILLDSNRTF